MLDPTQIVKQAIVALAVQDTPPDVSKSALDDLRNGGTLSRTLPGYQERDAQIEMAKLVEQTIQEEKQAIIEAGTGTGKSLSYLIPVVRSGKKVIISTANKALQDQLYNKDVPFCQKHIQPFEATLLKGKSNYLCLQRFDKERNEGMQVHLQDPVFKRIEKAVDTTTFSGDLEELSFVVSGEVRSRITVDDHDCARRSCPLFSSCYYYQAREKAKLAQVVITNHDLLLLNAQSNNKLLPTHDVVIIDEAHVLESVASKQFSIELRPTQILSLLALQRIKNCTNEKTCDQAREQAERLWEHLDSRLPGPGRIAYTDPMPLGLTLASTIETLSNQLRGNKPHNGTAEEEELHKRLIKRTDTLAANIKALFSVDDRGYVYFLERSQKYVLASMSPLDVASLLRDTLFTQNPTIVCTSATLSTPGTGGEPTFTYFQQQIGMDRADTIKRILPLVFDYEKNALLYVPNDLAEPAYGQTAAAAVYEQDLAQRMQQLVEASAGRAFLLFSSRRMLNTVADQITPRLKEDGYSVFLQGDLPTNELIKQFRSSQKPVLFGLRTFWEGVDVAGEALSLVVIDKLPFAAMDDPVTSAKLKYIESTKKQNAFATYSIPAITLQLKQGVGRLIRTDADRGVMAVLDTRLHTKAYGRKIVNCLPPARRTLTLKDVQDFYLPEEIRQFNSVENILTKHGLDRHTYLRQMTNREIISKMRQIISNDARSSKEAEWLHKGLTLILEKSQTKK